MSVPASRLLLTIARRDSFLCCMLSDPIGGKRGLFSVFWECMSAKKLRTPTIDNDSQFDLPALALGIFTFLGAVASSAGASRAAFARVCAATAVGRSPP